MLRDFFQSTSGTDSFGMISMILFAVFFILLVIHTLSLKKKEVDEFSRMPLDDSNEDSDKQ
jgi:cbb3-type cytochrome oxidase subunit 3